MDKDTVNVGFPLARIFAPIEDFFEVVLFCFFAIFLYGKPLNIEIIIIIFVLSLAHTYAIRGVSSSIAAGMLKIVFSPLGLPHDLMGLIYLSTGSIWYNFAVVVGIYAKIAIISLVSPKINKEENEK